MTMNFQTIDQVLAAAAKSWPDYRNRPAIWRRFYIECLERLGVPSNIAFYKLHHLMW